jgi:hypothetical protein
VDIRELTRRSGKDRLADVAQIEPNITLRLLPVNARITDGLLPKSPFTLFTFADAEDPPMWSSTP